MTAVSNPEDLSPMDRAIKTALWIRRFEEKMLGLYDQGKVSGTLHTCIGQEWVGVACAASAKPGDRLFSNHRCHGHFLAWTGDSLGLMAEILGRSIGVCKGYGGSQHVFADGFLANGIQGGLVPVAAGTSFAKKSSGSGTISIVFIGDGTLGEGVFYETLNIVSKWELPLLFVLENNGIAQTTLFDEAVAGSMEGRARGFDIQYNRTSTRDWGKLTDDFKAATQYVRTMKKPLVLEIETHRLKAHSKGDDTRSAALIRELVDRDPLNIWMHANPKLAAQWSEEIDERLAREEALSLSSKIEQIPNEPHAFLLETEWRAPSFSKGKIKDLITSALRNGMARDQKIFMLGQDILSPYGGAFKVTQGLSKEFPGRVWSTPISEAAMMGLSIGMALEGLLPVVEFMFGDFLALGFDQLLNQASKFSDLTQGRERVPFIVRTPMGGRRGYGATHSQSIEKFMLGIPHLAVIALNSRISPEMIYDRLFQNIQGPTLVIENKILYTRPLQTEAPIGFTHQWSNEEFPTVRINSPEGTAEVTIVCYGGMLDEVEAAITDAFDKYEIMSDVICPCLLNPLNIAPILESVTRTKKLLMVEEGPSFAAFGSEVMASLLEHNVLLESAKRIGCNRVIPASSELEKQVLPQASHIMHALKEMCRESSRV